MVLSTFGKAGDVEKEARGVPVLDLRLDGICNQLRRLLLLLVSLGLVSVMPPLVVPLRDLGRHILLHCIADSGQQAHSYHHLQLTHRRYLMDQASCLGMKSLQPMDAQASFGTVHLIKGLQPTSAYLPLIWQQVWVQDTVALQALAQQKEDASGTFIYRAALRPMTRISQKIHLSPSDGLRLLQRGRHQLLQRLGCGSGVGLWRGLCRICWKAYIGKCHNQHT